MKKIISTLYSLVFAFGIFSQQAPPQGINYQAMVYAPYGNQQPGVNSAGQLPANMKQVLVKFTIEEGNNGPIKYEETHIDTTDQYGLLNTVIGTGTPTSNSPGLFNQIDWSLGDPYLRVSITLTQYNSTVSSYQKLWSVPYALYADQANSSNYSTNSGHADSSDYASQAGNGITGVTDNGDGTLTFNYLDGSSYTTPVLTGLMGPPGPQGPAGQNGINGQSAYDIWLAQGNTGTQQDFLNSLTGLQGTNGQSAYDLWLAQGNTGTQQDFLNSLQGAPGPQGPQGPAGSAFQNGNVLGQVMYWDGLNWIYLNPGSQAQILTICNGVPTWTTGGVCPGNGTITSLNCASTSNIGTLTSGILASGVISNVPYTGGNGGSHNGQTVASTGVTGLTATLAPGNFATGAGSLSYSISGTANTNGTANFALNVGGQTCTLSLSVAYNLASQYAVGSVFCASGPTAIVDVTNPTTGKTWMDRNLGAYQAATSTTDGSAVGDLYQWGRRADGHQCRNSSSVPYTNLSSTDQPNNSNFMTTTYSPYDWRIPQNDNLWQGVNGINNPCPSGYRLPTDTELNSELLSWNVNNNLGAFASPLKLIMAGSRYYGNGSGGAAFNAHYWSSTVVNTSSKRLLFDLNSATINSVPRAQGCSVRCIKN